MKPFDAAVVGAGSFGAWTAYSLRRAGLSVALVDAYGPGNGRSSSGGASRIIRMGYGADELYTRWALRSLSVWKELSARVEPPLFHRTGVLWMGRAEDPYMEATAAALHRAGVSNESLERGEALFGGVTVHEVMARGPGHHDADMGRERAEGAWHGAPPGERVLSGLIVPRQPTSEAWRVTVAWSIVRVTSPMLNTCSAWRAQ